MSSGGFISFISHASQEGLVALLSLLVDVLFRRGRSRLYLYGRHAGGGGPIFVVDLVLLMGQDRFVRGIVGGGGGGKGGERRGGGAAGGGEGHVEVGFEGLHRCCCSQGGRVGGGSHDGGRHDDGRVRGRRAGLFLDAGAEDSCQGHLLLLLLLRWRAVEAVSREGVLLSRSRHRSRRWCRRESLE